MKSNEKLYFKLKIGKSEHKRSQLIESYFSFIDLLDEKNDYSVVNKSWKSDKKDIFDAFNNAKIYLQKNNIENTKIGREKSLFQDLNLIKEAEKIEPTLFANKILNSLSLKNEVYSLFNFSKEEYNFFLIIMFYHEEELGYVFFKLLKNIIEEKTFEDLILVENKALIEQIKTFEEGISKEEKKKIEEIILENIKPGSGNGKSIIFQGKKISVTKLKNKLIATWLNEFLNKGSGKETIKLLNEIDEAFMDSSNSESTLTFKKFYKSIFIDIFSKDEKYFLNLETKDFIPSIIIPKDIEELLKRVKKRTLNGVQKDYIHLITNHLNFIYFFEIHSDKILIKKEYKPLMEKILLKENELINFFEKEHYLTEKDFERILEIKKNIIPKKTINIKELYKREYGTLEEIIKILEIFVIEDNKENNINIMQNKIKKYMKNSDHIKEKCNPSTFYEFICSLALLLKKTPNLYSLEEEIFKDKIKETINLSFSEYDLSPIRFAAGRRPDAQIITNKSEMTILELTLQLNRQVSMEFDSVNSHLKKKINDNFNVTELFIVAPIIEKEFKQQEIIFKSNYEKVETKILTQKEFIGLLNK